jgi:hypothetical protein
MGAETEGQRFLGLERERENERCILCNSIYHRSELSWTHPL